MAETVVDQTLDTKGMNCTLPIIKARKALKGMSAGQILQVLSTDPGAVKDFEAFCRTTGNDLLESGQDDKVYTFLIRNNG